MLCKWHSADDNIYVHWQLLDSDMATLATTTEIDIGLTNLKFTGHRISSRSADGTGPELTGHASAFPSGSMHAPFQEDPRSFPAVHVPKVKRKERIQFAALCFCLFLAGYNDGTSSLTLTIFFRSLIWTIGTTGPLLPAVQRHYHVCSVVQSMLWLSVLPSLTSPLYHSFSSAPA